MEGGGCVAGTRDKREGTRLCLKLCLLVGELSAVTSHYNL